VKTGYQCAIITYLCFNFIDAMIEFHQTSRYPEKLRRYDQRSKNITIFLNSHLLSEIELTCDRVAFIRQGKIIRVASLAELQHESLQITIRVGQPTPALLAGLTQFGDEVRLDPHNGHIHLALATEDQIPQIANWLVSQRIALYELSPKRLSLEERFLQIVGDEMDDA
jgi:ABC-2 type transport system ATP-binding protein